MKGKHEICSMQILVIAATDAELEPLNGSAGRVDSLVTGVGVPATLYHLQKRIHQIGYDLVIQAGIAGSFNDSLGLGKTVLVKRDCFADIGMVEKEHFTPIFETGFVDKNAFPFTDGWLVNPNEALFDNGLPVVSAITVNKVSDSRTQWKQFDEAYHAEIESMEGAALHYICLQEEIPFLQIRSISNRVGERDKSKWLMQEAVTDLNNELTKLVHRMLDQ